MRYLLLASLLLTSLSAARGEHVDLLDSRRIKGSVTSVTDKYVIVTADRRRRKIELRDVAEIRLADPADVMTKTGRSVLLSTTGDVLAASDMSIKDGRLEFATPMLGRCRLPINEAAVFYQPPPKMSPEQLRRKCLDLKIRPVASDMLVVVKKDGKWLTVTGLLKAADAKTITFRWKNSDRKIARKSVPAIYFAKVAGEAPRRAGVLTGRDGSMLAFESVRTDKNSVIVRAGSLGERKIPRDKVAVIRFASDRVVNLDDLKPVKVTEYGIFKTFRHRVGRSAGGGPIRLGGRTYSRGLGLHSFCELSYQLDGKFATFVTVAGIDDSIRPGGDAVLTLLGDGKATAEPLRLTGSDAPKPIRLNVTKVRLMTIRVDFGTNGLDCGDHVNLAAARLIK